MLPFNRCCFFHKKESINKFLYGPFSFSRISKNYVFRFQIICHIDLVLLYFCFHCGGGGGGASGTLSNYNVLIQKWNSKATMFKRCEVLCWPESSLSDWRTFRSLAIHTAYNEDWSDWAHAQTVLRLCCAHISLWTDLFDYDLVAHPWRPTMSHLKLN